MGLLIDFSSILKDDSGNYFFDFSKVHLAILNKIIPVVLRVFVISIVMYLSITLGKKLINKFVEKQVKSKYSFTLNPQKAITIGEVLKSILRYLVYIIGIGLMFYDVLAKIPIAIVSAGGFAIGFGAQSLVKDLINGFFILFEDQYGVGDHITLNKFTGIVESIGIRTTVLRDFTGDIHLVPNGAIVEVTNHSRGDMRFMVDVDIAYEENIEQAIIVIKEVCRKFEEENGEELRKTIDVLGVTALNASGITIRTVGYSRPLSQWKMERNLRKEIKTALSNAGIEIPYPKTFIVNKNIE